MIKKIFVLVLVLSTLVVGCGKEVNNIETTSNDIKKLETRISELETLVEKLTVRNEDLTKELNSLKNKTDEEEIIVNLLDLNNEELQIYNKFKQHYNEEVLRDVEPLSICKMYFYAGYNKDYETEYELYIKGEEWLGWSKEEHMSIPDNERIKDFIEFKNVEDLKAEVKEDSAVITWKYDGDNEDEFRYGFNLVKNKDGIWKVSFMPMQ